VLKRLLKLGAYISLSELSLGNPDKSFPVISKIPPGRMLIESDLPAGSPGFTSEGYLERLKNTYNTAASILNMGSREFEQRIWDNGTVFTH
jgi:Tat protein secretion system quality control protein TatD with DNase activity